MTDGTLNTTASLVAGERLATSKTVPVLNPHDGSEIGRLDCADAGVVSRAVETAQACFAAWAAVPAVRRGEILFAAAALIEARAEELAALVAREAGKRLSDALGEAKGAVQCARFFAAEGQRLFGRTMPSGAPDKFCMTVRQPCGVAALITAANTPAPNFAWKVFPALICGNAVVLKPAEDTPLSADWLARICHEAGVPAGVLNVVQGLGAEVGPALVDHPGVDVISFTGSTRVGREIGASAGRTLKKVSLELGGKNPMVVCEDADLDEAARWAALSAFSNAGQRCAAGSRLIVVESVYDAFVEKLLARTRALKLGVEADCDLGPVINARQLSNITAAVEAVQGRGGRVLVGGARSTRPGLESGFYMEPTLVEAADPSDPFSLHELFGPVAGLYRARDYAHAVELAEIGEYALTACIHTRSVDRALAFAHGIRTGVAVVNGGTFGSEPHMPFGGLKGSGNGTREPGTEALDVYSELKDVYMLLNRAGL